MKKKVKKHLVKKSVVKNGSKKIVKPGSAVGKIKIAVDAFADDF
jgi:hypothetical protein